MKGLIKTLLREYFLNEKNESINYEIEHLDSYNGQHDYELGMYINGEIVGLAQYTLYNNELTISDIFVRPEMRRRGYGSRIIAFLKKEYPEYQYQPSMKTDLGSKFIHKDVNPYQDLNEGDKSMNEQIILPIMKNMEKAPNMGSEFGQDVEPSGTYVSHDDRKNKTPIDNYKLGKVTFNNPLIIDITDDTIITYKNKLSQQFKAKGKNLTNKLMEKGYDGLITRWPDGNYNELILFPNSKYYLS